MLLFVVLVSDLLLYDEYYEFFVHWIIPTIEVLYKWKNYNTDQVIEENKTEILLSQISWILFLILQIKSRQLLL